MTEKRLYETRQDKSSPNRNLAPISTQLDKNERLMIGGCILSELAERYGTPLYVIDEETLRSTCKAYKGAMENYYPGVSLPIYASKANSSLVISKIIASEGLGIDVVSAGELITALKGGINGDKIFLHGNNKSKEEILLGYRNNVNIVIDNKHDIENLEEIISPGDKPAKLMLRFTPGIECHTHEYIRTGHLDSKFGFDPDQLEDILLYLKKCSWADLTGLHAHIGSQIFELKPHKDLAKVMTDALVLAKGIGHKINDLNIGGGLGIRYVESDDPPSIDTWIKEIAMSVIQACKEKEIELPRLICEPGRSLIATAGVTIYKIGSRKNIPGLRTYLSIDGGMSDNPRPITYESLYTACLADRPLASPEEKVTIAGKHCESGDVLLKDLQLPFTKSGDFMVIFATGAYNASMSSNYNRIPRPAAVLVQKCQSELIQRRELAEDLLKLDIIPKRFLEVN